MGSNNMSAMGREGSTRVRREAASGQQQDPPKWGGRLRSSKKKGDKARRAAILERHARARAHALSAEPNLLSKTYLFEHKADEQYFRMLLLDTVKTIVDDEHLYDNLKCPCPDLNPVQHSFQARAAMNFYYGENIGWFDRENNLLLRTAYATGSGVSSIGLDRNTARVFGYSASMKQLVCLLQRLVSELHPSLNCDFNHISVKVYDNGKVVGRHCDIEYGPGHKTPKRSNSQEPGSPVALCTFGSTKILTFHRCLPATKQPPIETLEFRQENGSLFLLHPGDERLRSKAFWKHSAKLENPKGVSVTVMARVVKVTSLAVVHATTNLVARYDRALAPQVEAKFEIARKRKSESVTYEAEFHQYRSIIREVLHPYFEEDINRRNKLG